MKLLIRLFNRIFRNSLGFSNGIIRQFVGIKAKGLISISCYTRFEVRPFALLPTSQQYLSSFTVFMSRNCIPKEKYISVKKLNCEASFHDCDIIFTIIARHILLLAISDFVKIEIFPTHLLSNCS